MSSATPRPCVRPRVRRLDVPDDMPILLEEVVQALNERGEPGLVWLGGPPGAGKTTALERIAPAAKGWLLRDLGAWPDPEEVEDSLVLYTAPKPMKLPHLRLLQLEPWGYDDVLEYVLATHPERCESLMELTDDPHAKELHGCPELWSLVVDEVAASDEPLDIADTIVGHLRERLGSRERYRWVIQACLRGGPTDHRSRKALELILTLGDCEGDRLIRHRFVSTLLAAEGVLAELREGQTRECTAAPMPGDLLGRVGFLLRSEKSTFEILEDLMPVSDRPARIADMLHAADSKWLGRFLAETAVIPDLSHGFFPGADLKGAAQARLEFGRANLADSDWTDAVLGRVNVAGADLTGACLRGALIGRLNAARAQFQRASLGELKAPWASFLGADLTGANLSGAKLDHADFQEAKVEGLSLRNAHLDSSDFVGVDLRRVDLRGASLCEANLSACNLEGTYLRDAQLARAMLTSARLTASRMPQADLRGANLCGAELAEVDWEGANLSDADFTEASFHLGSSRSGLVFGYASQGTRTGFYTDEHGELGFKAPEEIRKANLRGTYLVGAKVERADFYLVDLRDAVYTPDQARHFRGCEAIL